MENDCALRCWEGNGVQFCQSTRHGNDVAPGIVGILRSTAAISTFQANHVTLEVGGVVVDSAIVGHGQRHTVYVIVEVQRIIAYGHPHQLIASVDVVVGFFFADPLGTDAAGVVLHLPVQDIQLDGCNTGAAHIAIGIGD